MLLLIAGITNEIGTLLARAALRRNFLVRGLAESLDALEPSIASQLESFVPIKYYDDTVTLDKAVTSVDAVVCAYAPDHLDLKFERQSHILRAAERADVKIFLASSWIPDWRKYELNDLAAYYASYIAFQKYTESNSSIKPIYIFTGISASFILGPFGPGMLSVEPVSGAASIKIWGKGDAWWAWTTIDDAAEFSIDILSRPKVQNGKGGCFSVKSGICRPLDIAKTYEKITGTFVDVNYMGTRDELELQLKNARKGGGSPIDQEYLALLFESLAYKGEASLENAETFVHDKLNSGLECFLRKSLGLDRTASENGIFQLSQL